MVLFAALPLALAAKALLLVHPLLAAGSTYALARALGFRRGGAFVAGLAYASTGFFQVQSLCCSPVGAIYAWLPFTLLGAEKAFGSTHIAARFAWWGIAAFGVSQSVAVWPGQGAYYAALIVGGYVVYRALVTPAGAWTRIVRLLQHEACIFLFGLALAAAGLLPRIEFNAMSNLAGGYAGANLGVGGLQPSQWVYLATPGVWYAGLSVLALAVAAPFVARHGPGGRVWYFGITSLGALLLTGTTETPLHWLLYHVLPGFANLHPHAPERTLTVAYLGPALLAGSCVSATCHRSWARRRGVLFGLVLLVAADLALGGAKARSDRLLTNPLDGIERLTPVDLATLHQPTPASAFLEQQSPSRFFGFAPDVDGRPLPYTFRFVDPGTSALLVNNRALLLGLQDVQGYDASHLSRYDTFLSALNGQTQNYHDATILATGLNSPLLDLLNARYVIVPVNSTAGLTRFSSTVYQDGQARILENSSAFPRAWIVHAAQQVAPGGGDSVALIASGQIDALRTVLLEEPPPLLEAPADPWSDQAFVSTFEADRVEVRTSSSAAGLLVVSEIYYPAWKAYVDGRPIQLYVADGALRAVSIPPGEHSVELRFDSDTLRIGLLVSGTAALLLVGLLLHAAVTRTPPSHRSAC
jgi:hypothetical protein